MAKDMADSVEEMLIAAKAEDIKIEREPLPPGWSIHEIGTARMGDDPTHVGDRPLLPPARREERLHRRRRAVRLRRHAEHHLVDSRHGVADDGLSEGPSASR